jgi:hypothetical protein
MKKKKKKKTTNVKLVCEKNVSVYVYHIFLFGNPSRVRVHLDRTPFELELPMCNAILFATHVRLHIYIRRVMLPHNGPFSSPIGKHVKTVEMEIQRQRIRRTVFDRHVPPHRRNVSLRIGLCSYGYVTRWTTRTNDVYERSADDNRSRRFQPDVA